MLKVRLTAVNKMFKFNFNVNSDATTPQDDSTQETPLNEPAQEIHPNKNIHDFATSCTTYETYKNGSVSIKHIPPKTVLDYLNERNISSCVLTAESSHSDLLSGVYEGGLKVWECTFDVLNYLESEGVCFNGARVLDLGCGAGLLGIFALLKGASSVVFQDYNREVLEFTTIPNVLLNGCAAEKIKCFSGDWEGFLNVCNEKFDFILTSETIYNTKSYTKLLEVFQNCCGKNGVIYVAAKSYYFGVGGGVQEFKKEVEKLDFKIVDVWKCDEGIKREILKITRLN